MSFLRCLKLQNTPIFSQLHLEEALLRSDNRNYVIFNQGTTPAIILGISSKPHELIDEEKYRQDPIPIIRRFTGGGCVVVDENTLFVTFIFNGSMQPAAIMEWTRQFYEPLSLTLHQNDYVIGTRKCGGNAQYIRKGRFLHHTSFLWDYDSNRMNLLKHPSKAPVYRDNRNHSDFLCTLKEHFASKTDFVERVSQELENQYLLEECSLEELLRITKQSHRTSTELLTISEHKHEFDLKCL